MTSRDSHEHKSDAQPPGDSQVTNPNKEIGDGDEIEPAHDEQVNRSAKVTRQ